MIEIEIPGLQLLQIEHLVLDFNGTLAEDGVIIDGVLSILGKLSEQVQIHCITADTYGTVSSQLNGHKITVAITPPDRQDLFKAGYITDLGRHKVACIGNGRNDRLMMKESALSIAVIQNEGAASETIAAAQIVCTDILSALSLFTNTKRITATLRN
jgi:soluble P-type ATPase